MTDKSDLLSQQIQILAKLEGIFMPEARRQRDALYKNQTGVSSNDTREPGRFVHYTSAEAALNIIRSKRVWARNATCMSDYREVQHGFEILRKFFSDKSKLDVFVSSLDACVAYAAMEAINQFNAWWDHIQTSTYIASLSEHDSTEDSNGRLSMWRAFGGNPVRVALVIKVPWYSGGAAALNLTFSPVAYLTEEETHGVIHKVIENIGQNYDFLRSVDRTMVVGTLFTILVAGVTCLKHDGFREEREWRAIYFPKFRPSDLVEHSTEVIGGVPQLIYKFPLDENASPALAGLDLASIFDRLIIGPSQYPNAMYEAFVEALTKIGVKNAENLVCISGIPIRS